MRKFKHLTAVCKDCERPCRPTAVNGTVDGLCAVCRRCRVAAEKNRGVASFGWSDFEGSGFELPGHIAHVAFEEQRTDGLWYPDSSLRAPESELFAEVDYAEELEPLLLRPRPRPRRPAGFGRF